jgi:hypothetical protein
MCWVVQQSVTDALGPGVLWHGDVQCFGCPCGVGCVSWHSMTEGWGSVLGEPSVVAAL